jgi:hypothetical protein
MRVRTAIAGTGLRARLSVLGVGGMTILASVSVSACSGGSTLTPPSFSPGGTVSPSASSSATDTASASESPSPTDTATASATVSASPSPSPSPSPFPVGAPATGGGGTAGLQDVALFALGGAALLAGAGSLAYRRRVVRNRR